MQKGKAVMLGLLVLAGCVSLAVEERRTRLVWAELPEEGRPVRPVALAAAPGGGATGAVENAAADEVNPGFGKDGTEQGSRSGERPTGTEAPTAARVPGRVDLNRATASELEALPGIGPVLARRILAYREAQGPFRSVEELQEVSGIGPARLSQLKGLVRVGENSGAAS